MNPNNVNRPQRYIEMYKCRQFRGKYLYTAMNELWLSMSDQERSQVNNFFKPNYAD